MAAILVIDDEDSILNLVEAYLKAEGEVRVVDVHIGHIRQKLEYDPYDPQFIVTVQAVGY